MRLLSTAILLTLVSAGTGCSLIRPTASLPLDAPTALQANGSTEVFNRIKEAKAQNAIVLQIEGDSKPIRVLPLPPDGQSVNVSDLLDQTGVGSMFGGAQVRVYRDSTNQMDGIRMDVKMDGKQVAPESDYALRPGDRIHVCKDETAGLGSFLGELIPTNAMRALRH